MLGLAAALIAILNCTRTLAPDKSPEALRYDFVKLCDLSSVPLYAGAKGPSMRLEARRDLREVRYYVFPDYSALRLQWDEYTEHDGLDNFKVDYVVDFECMQSYEDESEAEQVGEFIAGRMQHNADASVDFKLCWRLDRIRDHFAAMHAVGKAKSSWGSGYLLALSSATDRSFPPRAAGHHDSDNGGNQ